MDAETVNRLIEINRNFYSQFANDFSATRSSGGVNLTHILPHLTEGVKILDLGSGNGRLAQRLDRDGERLRVDYVGIDATAALVEIAQAVRFKKLPAEFRVADLTQTGWSSGLGGFDVALMLAVLHHIPSFDLRARVLREVRAVLKPTGKLLMTNWKFDENERLKKKLVPWSTVGIGPGVLEPGDALMAWRRGGAGFRYVHLLAPEEVERLGRAAEFKVIKQFYADAGLNLYSVLIPDQNPNRS